MNKIFEIVYKFLKWVSAISGLTYHEVNIITYFIIIPGVFVYLIGKLLKHRIPIILFFTIVIVALIVIPDFSAFSTSLFKKSVDFLNWFNRIGLNYIEASVVICVIIPVLILIVLLFINKRKHK